MGNLKGYLTSAEAARALGLSRARVNEFCREGRLKSVRVGNARLIPAAAVAAFKRLDRPTGRPKKAAVDKPRKPKKK